MRRQGLIDPSLLSNEASRLAELPALGLLDTPAEERFDRITRTAMRLFDVPIAYVSLVDANRQWFKSCQGLSVSEIPRSMSFCGHAILRDEMLVVADALLDPRFADNQPVAGTSYLHFYAGQPLHSVDGSKVGTLSIIDRRPRAFSTADLSTLRDLSYWVEHELQAVQLREAVELLAESEQRYRSLIAALDEGIVLQDSAGHTQMSNASAERILGLSPDQMIGQSPVDPRWRTIHEDGTPFPSHAYPALVTLRTGRPCANVIMGIHKPDGTLNWISVNSQLMFHDQATESHAVVCSFTDITEHKQVERALREAESRFRTLVEQLPAITYIAALNQHSSTIYTSPQIEMMLGFSQAEWMDDHQLWRKQIHPDDIEHVMADIERSHSTGAPVPSEYRMLTRDGQAKWFRDQAVIVSDDAGQPLFLQGIMFDITESKQTEAALLRSEAQTRALLDAIPDLIFRVRSDGTYLSYKADRDTDLSIPPSQFLGKTMAEVLPPQIARQAISAVEATLRSGAMQSYEYQTLVNSTPRDREARVVLSGEDETMIIVRDITDRKNMERMKNEFVSTVSHELRTPLTSILGSLGLIAGGVVGDIPLKVQTMIDIAYTNSERLVRLINDILDIEKIEAGKMAFNLQPVDLGLLVEHTLAANRAYGQQFKVTFVLECATADLWVNVDSDRLIQALTNLLSNAAKFSPPSDTVLIQVTRHAGAARVAISDHGPGIAESFRDRLFQKFAQADASDTRQKGGTGLGLNITKAIVENLGGRIDYAPNQDGGTTFFLDLPEWRAPAHQEASTIALPRVLICEDDHCDKSMKRGGS
jgi:PAS domain S-box-containing protein